MSEPRTFSDNGLALLTDWEGGRKLVAYIDSGGVWTIGVGHTGGVRKGDHITAAQCDALLREDVKQAERAVQKVKVPLTQNQFDALVIFTLNVGVAAFLESTLLRLLNGKAYDMVPGQMKRWNKDNGEIVQGLTNRRQKEINLWNTP
jgi:lysozyme